LFKCCTLCVFEPPFGGLGTTYSVHLGLIGKHVVDFLLLSIELFSLGVPAEALRAKIDRKSAISLQRGQFDPKFQKKGSPPPIIFARIVRPRIVDDSFLTNKLCSGLSSSEVQF